MMCFVKDIDYVFCSNAAKLFDKGIIIGTKAFLIFVPEITKVFEGRKRITRTYSFAGKSITETAQIMLKNEHLNESVILSEIEKWNIPGTVIVTIKSLQGFKVVSNWVNSSIVIKNKGERGWKPFCSRLGKSGKSFKSFYSTLEKR